MALGIGTAALAESRLRRATVRLRGGPGILCSKQGRTSTRTCLLGPISRACSTRWLGRQVRHATPDLRRAQTASIRPVSTTNVLASPADLAIVERLRASDEGTFMMLVEQHQAAMFRIARMYVSSRAVAEEVVQDAWLGIIKGLEGFEGRSSLRTWMYRIVANIAKTRGQREGRSVPFSSLAGDDAESAIDPKWFQGTADRFPGGWHTFPDDWRGIPESRLVANDTLQHIGRAIDALPPMQAEVIRLRDVLGWTSEEVRNALDLSETNQRVLLHRARSRVRREVDAYLSEGRGDG